jgi:hypothetical protein
VFSSLALIQAPRPTPSIVGWGKAREVSAWPVWMLLNRLLVFPYHLECWARHKDGDAAKIQILVRVHHDAIISISDTP